MKKRNIRKTAAALTALALCAGVLTGCGGAASSTASSVAASSAASSEASGADADALAAQNVADLIDAIYVQQRTDDTDAQCEAAKAAWDALTDAQKELVEGENADLGSRYAASGYPTGLCATSHARLGGAAPLGQTRLCRPSLRRVRARPRR